MLGRLLDGHVRVATGYGVDDRMVLGQGLMDPTGGIVRRLLEPPDTVLDLGEKTNQVWIATAFPQLPMELAVEFHQGRCILGGRGHGRLLLHLGQGAQQPWWLADGSQTSSQALELLRTRNNANTSSRSSR